MPVTFPSDGPIDRTIKADGGGRGKGRSQIVIKGAKGSALDNPGRGQAPCTPCGKIVSGFARTNPETQMGGCGGTGSPTVVAFQVFRRLSHQVRVQTLGDFFQHHFRGPAADGRHPGVAGHALDDAFAHEAHPAVEL